MYFTGFKLVDHNLKNAVGKLPERKYKLGVVGSQQIPFSRHIRTKNRGSLGTTLELYTEHRLVPKHGQSAPDSRQRHG